MKKAFTLIELLVAIAITGIIIVFTSQVLSHVSDAAGMGAATSNMLHNSRDTPGIMSEDFERMLSPHDGGFIVIIHRKINTVATEADSVPMDFRSDQIVFVKQRGAGEEPLWPANAADYQGGTTTTGFIKVWYGHVVRTDEFGRSPTGADLGSGEEQYPTSWILGRHALFLDPDYGTKFPNNQRANSAATDTAQTTGYNNTVDTNVPRRLWMGLTDIVEVGLREPSASNPAVYGPLVAPAKVAGWNDTLAHDMTAAEYVSVAMRHAYVTERLRVGVKPQVDYDKDGDYADSFQAWQIGQMVPHFMSNVTDFRVQFCGDYDGTPGLDKMPASTAPPGHDPGIMWYDIDNPPPSGFTGAGQGPIGVPMPTQPHADRAFIFRHSDNTVEANWPLMIRLQYRIGDPNGRIVDRDGGVGRLFEQTFVVNGK